MIVTDIIYTENKKYLVYLNDAPKFELYKSEIKSCLIEKGQDLSYEQQKYILENVIGKRAKKRAMHILEKHDKTERQLRDKLLENRYPQECIDLAVDYVKSYGYIDDRAYAERYVQYRSSTKSKKKLKQELMGKGISNEIVNEVLEKEEVEESAAIEKLILKKTSVPWELSKEAREKLIMSLMRKGFAYRDIDAVFRKLQEESLV
ncbi:MAG: recombination regulator RecX [Lachnospiraceae bacterium]|nr:recombination regulator RecX [Lachnospiraceae bacterium]